MPLKWTRASQNVFSASKRKN
uniref:Uncharacterized protein n=1 Tax=Rhizophora mucronata TaxID=61149 RepID=A0A2P2NIN8_RHIMU